MTPGSTWDRRKHAFWQDPAWISIILAILLHMTAAAYLYGRLASQVDMLQRDLDVIHSHPCPHATDCAAR